MKDIFIAMALVMTLAVPSAVSAGGPATASDDCSSENSANDPACGVVVVSRGGSMNGVGLGAGLALLAAIAAVGGASASGTN